MEQHNVWKYVHAQPFDGGVKINRGSWMCVTCVRVLVHAYHSSLFSHPMREYDLISADMFFLQRPFISHPAPPLNTSLIVPIDCSVPAMRSHNRLTYGLMFDWLSIWQPILQPCDSLSAVSRVKNTAASLSDFFKINWFPLPQINLGISWCLSLNLILWHRCY